METTQANKLSGGQLPPLSAAEHALLSRFLAAEEAERGRLARELHDHAGQNAAACLLVLAQLARADAAMREGMLAQLKQLTSNLTDDLHRIALHLHTPLRDGISLEPAMTTCLKAWTERTCVAVSSHFAGFDRPLPSHVESTAYRILQELLDNISRHAAAHHVSVTADRRAHLLLVIVDDDGRGFDVEAESEAPGTHLGLTTIRQRAALIGGTIAIESVVGKGTCVYLRLPLTT